MGRVGAPRRRRGPLRVHRGARSGRLLHRPRLARPPDGPAPAARCRACATPLPLPLLVTDDDGLLDELLRLCAAAGVTPEVARDAGAARRGWAGAAVVMVGSDLARPMGLAPPAAAARRRTWCRAARCPTRCSGGRCEIGAEDVAELPASEAWLGELLTEVADGGAARGAAGRGAGRVRRGRLVGVRGRAGLGVRRRGSHAAARRRPARRGARPGAGHGAGGRGAVGRAGHHHRPDQRPLAARLGAPPRRASGC